MNLSPGYLRLIAQRVLRSIDQAIPLELRDRQPAALRELYIDSFIQNVTLNCDGEDRIANAITFAAENELFNLQDSLTETLTVPWPHVEGKPRNYFPTAFAEVTGHTLRL